MRPPSRFRCLNLDHHRPDAIPSVVSRAVHTAIRALERLQKLEAEAPARQPAPLWLDRVRMTIREPSGAAISRSALIRAIIGAQGRAGWLSTCTRFESAPSMLRAYTTVPCCTQP